MAATKPYRLIATEEAFAIPEQIEMLRSISNWATPNPDVDQWRRYFIKSPWTEQLIRRLLDLDGERLDIMNRDGVDMHVLSITAPGMQLFVPDVAAEMATLANDRLAQVVGRNPTRFAGLGCFAPQDPARAAREVDRAIKTLKLNGLIVNSHTNGEYLDQPKYWPILEAIEASGAPLYLHPRNLPYPASNLLEGEIDLHGAVWGFQMETGLHAMRLIANGIFDRFPKLKVVLGHMGEAIPFWLYRIDYIYSGRARMKPAPAKRLPSEYFKDNFMITTSGVNVHPTLQYCHTVLGADNIMFAIDYPYQDSDEAVEFITSVPLPEADMQKITHLNAERVFGIAR